MFAVLLGCNRTTTPNSASDPAANQDQGQFDTESGPFAAGKKVFAASGCFRCHAIDGVRGGMMAGGPGGASGPPGSGGPGGMMGMRGPDLGKVAQNPAHTVEWLKAFVADPRSQKPDAKMPPQGQVKESDLTKLAEFLASLK